MTIGLTQMEKELMEMVAGAAAQKAAQEITIEVRAEIADQFHSLKNEMAAELRHEFTTYFGEMRPSTHIVQHDRLLRFVRWYDHFTEGLATKVMTGVVLGGAVIAGGAWFASNVLRIGH
jgi:hypothetical protein